MAKKETYSHIVREIRRVLGWSQEYLAQQLNCAMITVNKIENGSLAISKRLALRIEGLTDVPFEHILANRRGKPRNRIGELLQKNDPQKSLYAVQSLDGDQLESFVESHVFQVKLLVETCWECNPEKFSSLNVVLRDAIQTIGEEFGLAKELKERKPVYIYRDPKAESPKRPQRRPA